MHDLKVLQIKQSKALIENRKERAEGTLGNIADLVQGGQIIAAAVHELGFMVQNWDNMPGAGASIGLGEALCYIFEQINTDLPHLEEEIEGLLKVIEDREPSHERP